MKYSARKCRRLRSSSTESGSSFAISTATTAARHRNTDRDQDRFVMITFPTSQIQHPVLPRSATAALVQICLCHVNVAIDLPGLPQIPAPATDQSCAATSSANKLIGVGCPHAPPSCANLHSARRSRISRHPKPSISRHSTGPADVAVKSG
jgi:hypothetical protein